MIFATGKTLIVELLNKHREYAYHDKITTNQSNLDIPPLKNYKEDMSAFSISIKIMNAYNHTAYSMITTAQILCFSVNIIFNNITCTPAA